MPELPEVETVVRDLRPCLIGHRLVSVRQTSRLRAAHTVGVRSGTPRSPVSAVDSVTRRGKWILIALDRRRILVVHLGMTGQLTMAPAVAPDRRHTHLIFHARRRRTSSCVSATSAVSAASSLFATPASTRRFLSLARSGSGAVRSCRHSTGATACDFQTLSQGGACSIRALWRASATSTPMSRCSRPVCIRPVWPAISTTPRPTACAAPSPWCCAEPSNGAARHPQLRGRLRSGRASIKTSFAFTAEPASRARAAAPPSYACGWLDAPPIFVRPAK